MKLVKISRQGRCAQGFPDGDTVRLSGEWVDGPASDAPFTLSHETCLAGLPAAATATLPLADVVLEAPIDPHAKLICVVGVNYRDHASEIRADDATAMSRVAGYSCFAR